jgi:cytosine/adenosine deaminase-related metal-dependent hydrolase
MDLLIKGGLVLAPLEAGPPLLMPGDVRVSGQFITEIGPELHPAPGARVIGAQGCLVMPGMVNAHYHGYTNLGRGITPILPLEQWSPFTVELGGAMDDEDMRTSILLGAADMIHAGITTCLDHVPHLARLNAVAAGYEQTGMRVTLAPMVSDLQDEEWAAGKAASPSARGAQWFEEYYLAALAAYEKPGGLMRLAIGPNAPHRASRQLLEWAGCFARDHRLPVHTHLLETRWQAETAARHGESLVAILDDCGLLTSQTAVAHSVWLEDNEVERLVRARAMVVHNPGSNLRLGSGVAPVMRYVRKGIPVAMGLDGPNCGTGNSLWNAMQLAGLASHLVSADPDEWLPTGLLLKMVTEFGAAACGWGKESGAVVPKRRADLAVFPLAGVLPPAGSEFEQLIFNLPPREARTVLINGEIVLEGGIIRVFDEAALQAEAAGRALHLARKLV